MAENIPFLSKYAIEQNFFVNFYHFLNDKFYHFAGSLQKQIAFPFWFHNICLQRSSLTNSYLLDLCFYFYFLVIMPKANFLVHKSLWPSLIISLAGDGGGISRNGIAMSKTIGIFKAFDIYHQHLLRKGHANLFFLSTLYSIFMKMTEQLYKARLGQDLNGGHVHCLCICSSAHWQGKRRWMVCPRAQANWWLNTSDIG